MREPEAMFLMAGGAPPAAEYIPTCYDAAPMMVETTEVLIKLATPFQNPWFLMPPLPSLLPFDIQTPTILLNIFLLANDGRSKFFCFQSHCFLLAPFHCFFFYFFILSFITVGALRDNGD